MSLLTTVNVTIPNECTAGDEAIVLAEFDITVVMTETLTAGIGVTSLSVTSLPAPVSTSDIVVVADGIHTFQFTASGNAAVNATSIPVNSASPNWTFDVGSTVSFPVDPGTVSYVYRPGKYAATVTITYSGNDITRASKGVYFAALDTTGLAGEWSGYVESTGIGQATSEQWSFFVEEVPF